MAATQAVRFSATLVDELGTEAAKLSYLLADPAQTITQVFTAYDAWVAALDTLTDGQIVRGRVDLIAALPSGLKAGPVVGGRIEQTGNFGFSVAGTSHRYNDVVPSEANSTISGGKISLGSGSAGAAWQTLLIGAVLGGHYTNATSQDLAAAIDAFLSFRKRRRQLDRSSFEL